ncbi:MAG: ABC transporter substrate-binding protein, partial [Humidesulfovibrio sp.]|nr:ABC transporter substrate-binding protein [Humidesulfovibrio sp.]
MRQALFSVALCVVAALAACSRSPEPDKELRIGLLVPLSAVPSMAVSRGAAEALVAQVNAQGGLEVGGRKLKVRLLVEDTGGQVERAMAAAARLIRQERVSALVGPYYSRDA